MKFVKEENKRNDNLDITVQSKPQGIDLEAVKQEHKTNMPAKSIKKRGCLRKKRLLKKTKKQIAQNKEGETIMISKMFSSVPLTDREMMQEVGVDYVGYGTGASHEKIILGAGGEIGYDGFRDPREGHEGPIYADRVFINQRDNNIQGINFNDAQGRFCCSYIGDSYNDIKEQNHLDCQLKKNVELDESGVIKNAQTSTAPEQNQEQTQSNKGYNGGIKK